MRPSFLCILSLRKHTLCFLLGICCFIYLFKISRDEISSDFTGHLMFEVNLELIPTRTEESALSGKAPAWEGHCPGENLDSSQGDKQKLKVEKKINFNHQIPQVTQSQKGKTISLETRNSLGINRK